MELTDCVTGADIYTMLKMCCLCWAGHIQRQEDSCLPKDLLYNALAACSCSTDTMYLDLFYSG